MRMVTGLLGLLTGLKMTKFVLDTFRASLLTFNQVTNFLSSIFTVFCSITRSLDSKNMLVSSAKRKNFNFLDMLGKSFMYNKKSKGPKTEPCGTPQDIVFVSEEVLLTDTN